MREKLTLKMIWFSFFLFFVIWSIRGVIVLPYVNSANLNIWSKEIIKASIKTVIWVTFGGYYIKKYNSVLNISLVEMFSTKIKWKVLLTCFAAISSYFLFRLASRSVFQDKVALNLEFHPSQLIGSFLVVGFLEEIIFRGWFLNSLSVCISERKANIVSSILFTLIHFPGMVINGQNILYLFMFSIPCFSISLLFGWAFRKSRSLWTPIITHMMWNLVTVLL